MACGMRLNDKKLKIDIYWFVAFYLNTDMLLDMVGYTFALVTEREVQIELGYPLLCLELLFILYLMFTKRFNVKFVIVVFLYITVYALSLIITPRISIIFFKALRRGIINVIVVVYLMSQVRDYRKLLNCLVPYMYIAVVYAVIYWVIPDRLRGVSYMDFTYNSMFSMLSAFIVGVYGNSATNRIGRCRARIFFVFLFSSNFVLGGRGSILCVAICILFLFYFQPAKKKIIYIVLFLALGILIYTNYDSFITLLSNLFPRSRTIGKIKEHILINTDDSARIIAWREILRSFRENPFSIKGFLSDRLFLGDFFSAQLSSEYYGWYAHNFFFEQLYQFGVLAIPLMAWEVIVFIKKVFQVSASNDQSLKCIFVMTFGFCCGQLLVSSSYLCAKSFGIALGLMLFLDKRRISNENIIS